MTSAFAPPAGFSLGGSGRNGGNRRSPFAWLVVLCRRLAVLAIDQGGLRQKIDLNPYRFRREKFSRRRGVFTGVLSAMRLFASSASSPRTLAALFAASGRAGPVTCILHIIIDGFTRLILGICSNGPRLLGGSRLLAQTGYIALRSAVLVFAPTPSAAPASPAAALLAVVLTLASRAIAVLLNISRIRNS